MPLPPRARVARHRVKPYLSLPYPFENLLSTIHQRLMIQFPSISIPFGIMVADRNTRTWDIPNMHD